MKITIFTSGSTGQSKKITHEETDFYKPARFLCEKWKLTSNDVILNPFPSWTIANWSFCFFPAQLSGCQMINVKMEPLKFWDLVTELRPTVLTLPIRTIRTILKRKNPDLSFLNIFATGSAPVSEYDIQLMKSTGAKNIWNIYGSTECIPPVLMSNNDEFDFKDSPYYLEYDNTLIVNGLDTKDKFEYNKCLGRMIVNETWKS